jgi:hypothetical protein
MQPCLLWFALWQSFRHILGTCADCTVCCRPTFNLTQLFDPDLCRCVTATADDYASSKRLGAFLMMSQLQHTQPTSAMWLTGAAPNSLAIGLAHQQGVQLPASACKLCKLCSVCAC